jgi:hypothetical protein
MRFSELVEIMSSNGVVHLADIARELEVSPQSVSNWKARDRVPYKYVVEVKNRFDDGQSTDGSGERYVSASSKKKQDGRETEVPLPPFMMEKEKTFHLSEILAPIADNVNIIVKSTIVCFFLGSSNFLVLLMLPEKELRQIDLTYTTVAKLIVPGSGGFPGATADAEPDKGGGGGAIAQLIRGAVSPPSSGSGAASLTTPAIWPELLSSHAFAKRMLLTKYDTERYGEQKTLLEINQLVIKDKAEKPPTIWQKVFGTKKEVQEEPDVGLDTLIMENMGVLSTMIKFGSSGSFQTLTVTTFEPYLSVDICYILLEELQKFTKYFHDRNLQEKRQYIEERIEVIGKELDIAKEKYRVFTEANRTVSSLRLQWELEEVQQPVSLYRGIYTSLIGQLETVKIEQNDNSTSEPLIVDYPIPPLGPSEVKASALRSPKFVFLATIAGLGFGFVIALAKGYFSIIEEDEKRRLKDVKEKATLNLRKFVSSIRISALFRRKRSFKG